MSCWTSDTVFLLHLSRLYTKFKNREKKLYKKKNNFILFRFITFLHHTKTPDSSPHAVYLNGVKTIDLQ